MRAIRIDLTTLCLTLLSTLLYVFSFAPFEQGYLQWLAFLPLFLAVQRLTGLKLNPKSRMASLLFYGGLMAAGICLGGFYWIIYATQQYGDLPLPLAVLLLLVFCLIGQLQLPLYLLLRQKIMQYPYFLRHRLCWVLLSGLLYAGIESLYPKIFLDTAGNAFSHSPLFRQGADLGGPFFLTTLIILVNELWLVVVLQQKNRFRNAGTALLVIAAMAGYGSMRMEQISALKKQNSDPQQQLKFSLIQANIGDFLKLQSERGETSALQQVTQQYLSLSDRAASDANPPDLIVWPETAYPALFEKPSSIPEKKMEESLKSFALEYGGTLAFGGYDQDPELAEYNSIFFWNPHDFGKTVYHKSVLLMFGETLPFIEFYPEMKSWFPTMGFFGRGPGAEVVEIKNKFGTAFRMAPSICYEGLIPSHSAAGALAGADFLLNVTNDSWFGPWGEPDLHLALTVFRSIETRLPMVRSTNTGYTTVIDETGEITYLSHLNQAEVITAALGQKKPIPSLYLKMSSVFGGNWYARLTQIILLLVLGFLSWKKFKEKTA